MDIQELTALIQKLEQNIAELPIGYISKKTINGKVRYYHQWKEDGKVKSRYLKDGESSALQQQIAARRQLQAQVKKLKAGLPRIGRTPAAEFECHVIKGNQLQKLTEDVRAWQKRDCFAQLTQYLYNADRTRVCIVYGLRRTGKTTMLKQAIADMNQADSARAVYIKLRVNDTMAILYRDLQRLQQDGFKYIFLDEITLMEDFIDSAATLSDIFVGMGMKIVLSGTDSLGFWFTLQDELYDRARLIHTTFIPYREYSRLLGIDDIDEYIRYGGTLRAGEIPGGQKAQENLVGLDGFTGAGELAGAGDLTGADGLDELAGFENYEEASFYDDESTRRYVDTAICRNIQHSMAFYEQSQHFQPLYSLYKSGELTGAINRLIEDINHSFVLEVLERDFKSTDLRLSARNLRRDRDPERRTNVLDIVDIGAVTKKMMHILEIKNKTERTVPISAAHLEQLRKFMTALDLTVDCPLRTAVPDIKDEEHLLFTQPGMRYCQARTLVNALLQDNLFLQLSGRTKDYITGRILEEVRGRMLEDIILLETAKALGKRYEVFKYQFEQGEFDMVIYDTRAYCCAAYEIKHSTQIVPEQARHLTNAANLRLTSPRYGELVGRFVLYRGENADTEDGIAYRSVTEFLKALPAVSLHSGLE